MVIAGKGVCYAGCVFRRVNQPIIRFRLRSGSVRSSHTRVRAGSFPPPTRHDGILQ